MSKNIEIYPIFPTALGISFLKRDLTSEERSEINLELEKTHSNIGNVVSNNSYILEKESFKNLKCFLEDCVTDYFSTIIGCKNSIQPYITQSWLNITKKNQYHHKHHHPNSIISGVFYIEADSSKDKIIFYNEDNKFLLDFYPLELNPFNATTFMPTVESNQLLLFPSSMIHMVPTVDDDRTRISLSFNTFFKGEIGVTNGSLTELKL